MASFINEPNKSNDPSYLGTSQGTEKAGLQQLASTPDVKTSSVPDYKSDTTYGKIFAGVGDVLDTAVKGTDTAIKEHIKEDLFNRIDNIRDQFGVAQAVASPQSVAKLAADSSEGIPKAVEVSANRMGNRLEGFKAMYHNGDMQDSSYWTRVEAEVRGVRAQYPGYRDYIDEKTSNIVGTTPANALRRSLLSDVADLYKKQQSSTDKWTTYVHQNDEIINQIVPNYNQLKAQGKEPPQSWIEDQVANFKATDANYDRQIKKLNAKNATDKDIVEQAASTYAVRGDQLITRELNAMSNVAGMGTYKDFFLKLQSQVTSGKPLTPEQSDQLRNNYAQLESRIGIKLQNELTRSWSENDPNSRSFSYVFSKDPAKLKALNDQIMERLKPFKEAIFSQDKGLLADVGASNKAVDEAATAELFRKNKTWQMIGPASKMLGPNGAALLVAEEMGNLLPGFREISKGNIPTGVEKDLGPAWQRLKDKEAHPDNYKVLIKDQVAAINGATDPKASVNAATALFSPKFNFLDKIIEPAERNNTYANLTSPVMVKRLQHLRDTPEGAQVWDNYLKWTTSNAFNLMKTNGDTLQEAVRDPNAKLTYDPKTYSFDVETAPGGIIRPGSFADRLFGGGTYGPAKDEINKTLRGYGETMKAAGINPTTAVNQLVSQLVNTAEPKSKGLFESMAEALKAHANPEEKPKSTPVKAGASSNLSDQNIIAVDTKNIPDGMSAVDYIKMLQQQSKRPQR